MTDGFAELLGKATLKHSAGVNLKGKFYSIGPRQNLKGKLVVKHSASANFKFKLIIRHSTTKTLKAKTVIRHPDDKKLEGWIEVDHQLNVKGKLYISYDDWVIQGVPLSVYVALSIVT